MSTTSREDWIILKMNVRGLLSTLLFKAALRVGRPAMSNATLLAFDEFVSCFGKDADRWEPKP
jgi:hypothetical protein